MYFYFKENNFLDCLHIDLGDDFQIFIYYYFCNKIVLDF